MRMFLTGHPVICYVCLIVLQASFTFADDKDEFLKKYRTESEILLDFYRNATIKAKVPASSSTSSQESTYYAAGSRFRLDEIGGRSGHQESLVVTPDLTFITEHNPRQESYAFQDAGTGPLWEEDLTQSIRLRKFPMAPTTILEADIYDFLSGKAGHKVSIDEVTSRLEQGTSILQIAYSYPLTVDGKTRKVDGIIELLPDSHYALSSYTWGAAKAKPAARVCQVEYNGKDEQTGVPLTKKVVCFRRHKDGKRTDQEVYEIASIIPGAAPDELFTVEHFGLPDPNVKPDSNYRPFFVIAGLLLIAFAAYGILRKR